MYKLIKALNKFNGNICCIVAINDSTDVIFECDYNGRTLSYDFPSTFKFMTDVCVESSNSYLVVSSGTYIGRYSNGSLDETYIYTGLYEVDKIVINNASEYYLFSKKFNRLYKYYNLGVSWELDLPDYDLKSKGKLVLRESDGAIIYHNNSNVHIIRDDSSKGTLLNSLNIGNSGDLSVIISNEFNPVYTYVRYATVVGSNLERSSSSSSSS